MKRTILCIVVLASACAHRVDLMKANAVSMKYRDIPEGAKLETIGDISSRYCAESFKRSNGKDIGMIDEAIKMAESEHKVDFILHANFYHEGDCVIVEGEGALFKK